MPDEQPIGPFNFREWDNIVLLAYREAEMRASHSQQIAANLKAVHQQLSTFATEAERSSTQLDFTLIQASGQYLGQVVEKFQHLGANDDQRFASTELKNTTFNTLSAFVAALPSDQQPLFAGTTQQIEAFGFAIETARAALRTRLEKVSPHLVTILDGALASVEQVQNRLIYTNACTGFRELIRELLAKIAPDSEIKASHWFVANPSSNNGVTRRHRLEMALFSYVGQGWMPASAVAISDQQIEDVLAQINRLSSYTHVTSDVLARPDVQGQSLVNAVLTNLVSFLDYIVEVRRSFENELAMRIQPKLEDFIANEKFDEIEGRATHVRPEKVEDLEVDIDDIQRATISVSFTGSIACENQFGSDSDVEAGDGLTFDESYSFSGTAIISTSDLNKIEIEDDSFIVSDDPSEDEEEEQD